MNWVIQDDFYSEDGFAHLTGALVRMGFPHTVVKVLPASRALVPEVTPQNPVMVCGSTTMCKIAQDRGWSPGSFFNDNLDFRAWGVQYGDLLLNSDAKVMPFKDVTFWWPRFFIRAADDSKALPGKVMDWPVFEQWKTRVLASGKDNESSLVPGTTVVVAAPKTIHFERRYFVVDGKIISNSQYRVGGQVNYSDFPDEESDAFVRVAIRRFVPARAFVIDIAGTPDGLRIVEINCFNSAAFYACNIAKIIDAAESMRED